MKTELSDSYISLMIDFRQLRKKKKLSQKQMADICKISTTTISKIENGDYNVRLSSVLALMYALGFSQLKALHNSDLE